MLASMAEEGLCVLVEQPQDHAGTLASLKYKLFG